jgi:hypothetical protein
VLRVRLAVGPCLVVIACASPAAAPAAPTRAQAPAASASAAAATEEPARSSIVVRPQTGGEAFDYLWLQLGQMPFFRAHGYTVGLPSHPLFQRLAEHGLDGADRDEARRVFVAEVYDAHAFDAGLRAFATVPSRAAPALDRFAAWERAWGFVRLPRYQVLLTLYGPGGSYDTDHGVITVLTTIDGAFRIPPLENAVHEMVHMGIERPIVARFGLAHEEKERLVDLVCQRAFHDLLPAYRAQPMGPPALDAFIDDAALADLPAVVARYVASPTRGH